MRLSIFLLFLSFIVSAQTDVGLVAYYSFENCDGSEDSQNGINAVMVGNPGCECGVKGNALRFTGSGDGMALVGTQALFNTSDFTISLYFKANVTAATQDLLSKAENCDENNAMFLKVSPVAGAIEVGIYENSGKKVAYFAKYNPDACWHHVVIVREKFKMFLYLDGELIQPVGKALNRVNISNTAILGVSNGPCLNTIDIPFTGLLDEVRLYERALSFNEVKDLYFDPDHIQNVVTDIFLGKSLDIEVTPTCASNFSWSPTTGVSDPTALEPSISPIETTIYKLEINYLDCVSTDSIRINVIDPNDVNCANLYCPNAFTPNGNGPIKNETFGISNPEVVSELLSFEIFDRWGGRVFATSDQFQKWDGTFKGQSLNSGAFLYKIRYKCGTEELTKTGTVTLLR